MKIKVISKIYVGFLLYILLFYYLILVSLYGISDGFFAMLMGLFMLLDITLALYAVAILFGMIILSLLLAKWDERFSGRICFWLYAGIPMIIVLSLMGFASGIFPYNHSGLTYF